MAPSSSVTVEEAPVMEVTVGGWLGTTTSVTVTVTSYVSEPVAPSSSVTVRVKVTAVSDATCEAVYCRIAAFPVVIVTAEVSLTVHRYPDMVPSPSVAVPVRFPEAPSFMEEAPVMEVTVGGVLVSGLVTVTFVEAVVVDAKAPPSR